MLNLNQLHPNLVQSIRAYRLHDLQSVSQEAGHHFLFADLSAAQSKQDVLDSLAQQFNFPKSAARNFDTFLDCLTLQWERMGAQPGFMVVLNQVPTGARFDKESRETLLEMFRDAAEFWAERDVAFRCFYSFSVSLARSVEIEPAGARPRTATGTPKVESFWPGVVNSVFDTACFLRGANNGSGLSANA